MLQAAGFICLGIDIKHISIMTSVWFCKHVGWKEQNNTLYKLTRHYV